MLRLAGYLDVVLPGQRRGESLIDFLVRQKVAIDAHHAAFALIEAQGLTTVLNENLLLLNEERRPEVPFPVGGCNAPDGA
jgi:hypothetical protein